MAGKKKQEIQLQREIETQEEWEECMAREGIWVIDVYQEWCGPCQALMTNFRRLKNELGDPLLNYAIAKADTIDALEKYRGRCEPTFLFYAGGILVAFIHGANSPKIQRTITEQLAQEHKVLEGQSERKEVKDPVMTRAAEKEIAQQEAEQLERELEGGHQSPSRRVDEDGDVGGDGGEVKDKAEPKGITVAIIKPDAVAQGKTDEIIQQIKDQGIEILADTEKTLTEDEAVQLYHEHEDESYFDELVKFVSSGPCRVLVLTKGVSGDSVLKDWRDIIGPTNVEEAKESAPDSLRAKYGESGYVNALHGSTTSEAAAKELAFFFPQMATPTYKKKKENIQRTLAIIRPEVFNEKKDEILAKISEAGFQVALYKEVQLTKDQASDFYREHEEQSYFSQLIENMTSGPVLALCLAGDEAIDGWRDMLGPPNVDDAVESAPNSLRAKYTGASGINQFHGSNSPTKAKEELDFFFPMEETVAVIKPTAMGTKDAIIQKIHEAGFKIAARKETTITQEIAEILYPKHTDKEYYDDLVESMTSGPTMFMVLTREDAVYGWRQVIGETNPEEAKEQHPDCIRAQFGQDILNNAVHGSSDNERAREEMKAVFGDLQFNEDGSLRGQQPELEEASEALKIDRSSPSAETAPEYRQGDTTADETADTTQDITADTTQEPTTDRTEQPTGDETTAGDTTQAEETTAEETEAETTQEDTTMADTTQEPTVDETQADETEADETQADETQADETQADESQAETTTGDVTQDQTTEEKTEEPTSTDPESNAGETTAEKSNEDTQAVKEEDVKEEEVKGGEKSDVEAKGESENNAKEESKDETKQEEQQEQSSNKEEEKEAQSKADATAEQTTTES